MAEGIPAKEGKGERMGRIKTIFGWLFYVLSMAFFLPLIAGLMGRP